MSGVKQKAKTSVEMRICNKCGLIDILDTNNWRKYPKEWRIAVSSHSKRCDGEFEWRIDPRLADAQEEIKELKNKNREYAKLVAGQAEKNALEIAKLKSIHNYGKCVRKQTLKEVWGRATSHDRR